MVDGLEQVHEAFRARVAAGDLPDGAAPGGPLDAATARAVFRAQCLSRQLDLTARRMQAAGQGFYTIGSSGHEGMAAVAAALRPDDMAFLHYRDGAFQAMRAAQAGLDPTRDMLMSFATAKDDPISGGRHKVLGSRDLMIPPQTSTIASHLPKAVGAAFSVGMAKRHRPEHRLLADDAIVMASFGDASTNHSTAQGAFNSAGWTAYQSLTLPLLFVCEDNGIGISVRTPGGWIQANFESRPGLEYFHANGLDLYDTYRVACEAEAFVRNQRRPAFLHLDIVRLGGHAGSDVEAGYLPKAMADEWQARDPLLVSVRLLAKAGVMTPGEALALYDGVEDDCARVADGVARLPRLGSAAEVMESLIPPSRACATTNGPDPVVRAATLGAEAKQQAEPQPMARLIGWALSDLMLEHREIVVMGEDVGAKGGVYGVTRGLQARFGRDRVMDTLLDEQSILGLAIGLAHNGFVPVPEIQFLAYLHNAEDQLRGEAATLPFFSCGQFTNPMVLRIAGLGYQRGFGGHFHNDNSLAVLRDIPGLILAVPSRGDDSVRMLRECVRLAREEQRVVVFVEPIALYQMRDLHEAGDCGWMCRYPDDNERIPLGEVGVVGDGPLAIVSYGNGHYLSLQAALELERDGIGTRVIDLRWLAPLPEQELLRAISGCGSVLVVDECRRSGNLSEALITLLAEKTGLPAARIAAEDSFIATGPAYAATMPSAESVAGAARTLWADTKVIDRKVKSGPRSKRPGNGGRETHPRS